jgi:hypothetical protein
MRRVLVIGVMTASALALSACGKKDAAKAPAASDAPAAGSSTAFVAPQRKPGLWSQTVTTAGMTQTAKICTDATTEAKLSLWGGQATKDMCSQQEMKRALNGDITFSSVCSMGSAGTITSTGTMTGDFSSKYVVNAKSVTTGAGAPQMNGEREMTMEAVWLGHCPADFKPGDMEVAQGVKFNILEMDPMGASSAAGQ